MEKFKILLIKMKNYSFVIKIDLLVSVFIYTEYCSVEFVHISLTYENHLTCINIYK